MQGKINITIDDKPIAVSALTFLREGINPYAKKVLEAIMDSIVEDTCDLIRSIIKNPKSAKNLIHDRKGPLVQLNHFAVLLGNYPELSPTILNHKVTQSIDIPEEYRDLLPQWTPGCTFIHFILKYFAYLYHFSTSYFIIPFVDKVQTPIFIDYEGEPLLLSAYNEFIIFAMIQLILKETLVVPEKFLRTIYTTSIWSILSNISISILQLVNEPKQKEFKLQIIKNLYSLCLTALKVYNKCRRVDSQLKDETQVVYIFMGKLAEIEVSIKARNQLFGQDKPLDDAIVSRKKLPWVSSILKDLSNSQEGYQYIANYSMQIKVRNETNEIKIIKEGYSPETPSIAWENTSSNLFIFC